MRQRTTVGVSLLFASFAFFGAGAFVLSSAMDAQERAVRQKAATEKQCMDLLETLPGATVAAQGGEVTIVMRDVVDPRKSLSDATVAALMCPGKTFSEVCLGDKCQGSQDSVILRLKMKGK